MSKTTLDELFAILNKYKGKIQIGDWLAFERVVKKAELELQDKHHKLEECGKIVEKYKNMTFAEKLKFLFERSLKRGRASPHSKNRGVKRPIT